MPNALVILPYADPSGELKVCASDRDGKWQCNVNFLPATFSLDETGHGLKCNLRSWKGRRRLQTEKAIVVGFNLLHLNEAKSLVEKRLRGLDVLVTEAGVVLIDSHARSRERVETARLWLSLAGQYIALAAASQTVRFS